MPSRIRAIVVAEEAHAALIVDELGRGRRVVDHERVDDDASLRAAVGRGISDVVLSDWTLPRFSASSALALLSDLRCPLPLVIVAGRIGEEAVAEGMRAGARDVVLVENLDRLNAVVEREISAARPSQSAVDLSEQERVERELRSATAFLDSIVENIPLMVVVKDAAELRFQRINRAGEELLGRTREALLGKNDYDLFRKEQAESIRAKDRAVLAMAIALDVTEEPMTTARGPRWLRTMKIAIRDEHGVARHLLDISEDITPQREMAETLRRTEEQFRQAHKMEAIGKLAGGVAHDFNNMLSIVLSYAELARKTVSAPGPLATYLTEIVMAATGAAELTKQLLAFSRQQVALPRILDINDALARMDTMFRRVLEEDVELRTAPAPDLWTVSADPTQIDQILMNLIVNARDAMPAGGTLTIETANVELDETYAAAHVGAKPGPHVMLAVSDEGTGMDPQTMAQIFEPFFTTKALGEGTGLGLSTVYGIVRQSGGSVWVYSELGKGTTFKIYLPRAEAAGAASTSTEPAPADVAPRRGRETILVVEDEESVRRLVRRVLLRAGYDVLDAGSPAEAILVSEQHPGVIDLLLTDVVMPRMSGRQLADRLVAARPSMRVVFMSGYTANVVIHRGILDAGVVLLQKPITPELLLRKLAEVLAAGRRS